MVLGKFAVRAPIRKCLQKVDSFIHIFQQNEPVCSHCKLATNIMRRTINVLISPRSGRMRLSPPSQMQNVDRCGRICYVDMVATVKLAL